jgi:hypothetical protein
MEIKHSCDEVRIGKLKLVHHVPDEMNKEPTEVILLCAIAFDTFEPFVSRLPMLYAIDTRNPVFNLHSLSMLHMMI